ncbi:glycosyltransferase family 4 protein [Terasakiella sp. SH-1]|uniref:glycosyltransferase family 4 protein n=1 Tax=Terasakiella sp. SH-1 TaxID=2560057 RepID=UPI0010741111|nr:glycosyltransferase family 4 protein [Terasakiella sp. SH-1]
MDKSQQTIWQLLDSRQPGGIESHILELCIGLKEAGWAVKVVFLTDYGRHPLKEQLGAHSIAYKCLDGKANSLWEALSDEKPLVLHTHGYKAGFLGRFFGNFHRVPVISTYHAGEETKGKLALYTFLDRLSAPLSTPIAVSKQIAKKLPKKTHCINNFVSIPDHSPTPYQGRVAFVGRLSEEKGPDLFCKIAQRSPQLSFHLYGDGPMRKELEETYGNHVTFHGQVNMEDHWQNIDLLCMPSRFEGLPMAALEAMARSIPVLASNVGAFPVLIEQNQTGWVLPLEQLSEFNTALNHWHHMDTHLRQMIGQTARQKVKALYSPQAIIPQIEEIYLQAAGE